MAIIFSKDISTTNVLMAYNNNVVKFSSNNNLLPKHCTIVGLGINAFIYPHPDGSFYFNFIDYISAAINTQNFEDNVVTNLVSNIISSFAYNVGDGCYITGIVVFEITLSNNLKETISRELRFLAGANQIEDHKKQVINADNNFTVLSPVADRSDNTINLKYWEGYPFSFSFYTNNITLPIKWKNNSNAVESIFTPIASVIAFHLDNGSVNVTNSNIFPLIVGTNQIEVFVNDINQNLNLNIVKENAGCGVYVKWLNKFGRYNFWLLNDIYRRTRSTKYGIEINNDFDNLEDTTSPTHQFGKTSFDTLRCNVKKLNASERDILIGILESPKIYMFTGERFSKAEINDWIEVTLKNTSLEVEDILQKTFKFNLDLELPTRYGQTL